MRFILSLVAVVLATSPAAAHHSTAYFDGTTTVSVKGTLTRVEWRSPHIYFTVAAMEPTGETVEWTFESVPTPLMVRAGWTREMVTPGDVVEVQGHPRTEGGDYAWLRMMTKEDGTALRPPRAGTPGGAPPADGPPGVQAARDAQ
jgi:hypothetical protein